MLKAEIISWVKKKFTCYLPLPPLSNCRFTRNAAYDGTGIKHTHCCCSCSTVRWLIPTFVNNYSCLLIIIFSGFKCALLPVPHHKKSMIIVMDCYLNMLVGMFCNYIHLIPASQASRQNNPSNRRTNIHFTQTWSVIHNYLYVWT